MVWEPKLTIGALSESCHITMSMLIVGINKIEIGSGVESGKCSKGHGHVSNPLFHSNADKPQLFDRFIGTNVVHLYQQSQQMQICIFVLTLQTKFLKMVHQSTKEHSIY